MVVALNPQVLQALQDDLLLFLVYQLMYGSYDPDIHPIHNPDARRGLIAKEAERLQKARARLTELQQTWKRL